MQLANDAVRLGPSPGIRIGDGPVRRARETDGLRTWLLSARRGARRSNSSIRDERQLRRDGDGRDRPCEPVGADIKRRDIHGPRHQLGMARGRLLILSRAPPNVGHALDLSAEGFLAEDALAAETSWLLDIVWRSIRPLGAYRDLGGAGRCGSLRRSHFWHFPRNFRKGRINSPPFLAADVIPAESRRM